MKKNFLIASIMLASAVALAFCSISCCRNDAPVQHAKHVLIIGMDGWAAEAVRRAPAEDLPNLHYLMDHGCWTLSKRSVMPSASAINWASMFNGLPTEMHGFDKWNSTHGTIPSTSVTPHGSDSLTYASQQSVRDFIRKGATNKTLKRKWNLGKEEVT